MAMFKFEDSSQIDLNNVHTTSDTLVEGKRVTDLKVKNATAAADSSQVNALEKGKDSVETSKKGVARELSLIVGGGVILLVVTAVLIYFFPFLKPA